MPDTPSPKEVLAQIIALATGLPTDPAEYAGLPAKKRRSLRVELESAVGLLSSVAEALDTIRQPKHVFDPTSPKIIGKIVADTLLLQEREPLARTVDQKFYGAGVYAIYYCGAFKCYQPISGKDHPIYVGKADPEELHAHTAAAQGTTLHTRLKDHERSIKNVTNLDIEDFECRYLVVRSAWIETAEDLLIHWFNPVWNNELKVCYGFGKHGDKADTRKNERSPWDTIHPGRPWATADNNTPNKRTMEDIYAAIAAHYAAHPVRG
ncbi:MAG: Eco29kI family restriction endonuclease [Prosthecobacter sp.]|nr:Eco29kI family restriction endonuclease [Prosthecobacter sp.]